MIDKEKASLNMRKQWMKFGCAFFFYVLFIIWMSPRTLTGWILTLLGAMFIFDCYVSKKVRWQWWKDAEGPVKFIMSWVDALVFALVVEGVALETNLVEVDRREHAAAVALEAGRGVVHLKASIPSCEPQQ